MIGIVPAGGRGERLQISDYCPRVTRWSRRQVFDTPAIGIRVLTFVPLILVSSASTAVTSATRLWRAQEDGVVCMRLDVLLQILRSLKSLAAEIAFMRLQRDMDANMRRDMVALHRRCPAVAPLASEIQVVCALSANMPLTNVILR